MNFVATSQGGLRHPRLSDDPRRRAKRAAALALQFTDDVAAFRQRWMERAQGIARLLELPFTLKQASDPFFGRRGQMKAVAQLQAALKFELPNPVRSSEKQTARTSFSYHFGTVWDMKPASSELAHSGCVAFGMDRLAVAMFAVHGLDRAAWPRAVRAAPSL